MVLIAKPFGLAVETALLEISDYSQLTQKLGDAEGD